MKSGKLRKILLIASLLAFSGLINEKTALSSDLMMQESIAQYSNSQSQDIDTAPPEYIQAANEYYTRGTDFYRANEYTKAISELEQALKLNPQHDSARINLAASHISRGNYFLGIDRSKALNDLRRAIFYLKYDDYTSGKPLAQENLASANSGLSKLLRDNNISLEPKNRLRLGKILRGEGNFKEAVVELNEALADPNLRLETNTIIGDIMLVLGKSKAANYYQNASSLDPDNSNLHRKLAQSLYNAGDLDNAVKEYNAAFDSDNSNKEILDILQNIWEKKLNENPQDAVSHMNLGVVLQKKGNFEGAEYEYNEAGKIDPNNVTLRLNQGTLYQAKGDYATALRAYDTLLQVNPTDSLVHYYRATALKQMGNITGAVDEFGIILKMASENVAIPKSLVTTARKAIYETARQAKTPEETLAILDYVAKSYPNDANAQYNLAFELHNQKKADEALNYYQKTISLDPKLIDAYLNTAAIYNEKGQSAEAIATLQNGLVINPNNKQIKDLLSQVKGNLMANGYEQALKKYEGKDYEGAIQDYLRVIELSGPSPDVYVSLGAAYQSADKINDAIIAYNKALALDKNNSLAHYYLGTIYYSQKNYEKALISYQKAQTQDPQNNDIKEAIKAVKLARNETALETGLNEYNAKRYVKALQIFNTAIQNDPSNGYAYYYRGLVYDAQKKYLPAIADYKKAVAKSKDLNLAYYGLAVDYDMLNLRSEAKQAYQKFISNSQDQNDEYVKYAKLRLKKLSNAK